MVNIIKALLFLLVNAAGFFTLSLVIALAIKLGLWPKLPDGPVYQAFSFWILVIGPWVWIPAGLVSIGYFFAKKTELRTWLILAPIYVPALYGVLVLVYFNFATVQ